MLKDVQRTSWAHLKGYRGSPFLGFSVCVPFLQGLTFSRILRSTQLRNTKYLSIYIFTELPKAVNRRWRIQTYSGHVQGFSAIGSVGIQRASRYKGDQESARAMEAHDQESEPLPVTGLYGSLPGQWWCNNASLSLLRFQVMKGQYPRWAERIT